MARKLGAVELPPTARKVFTGRGAFQSASDGTANSFTASEPAALKVKGDVRGCVAINTGGHMQAIERPPGYAGNDYEDDTGRNDDGTGNVCWTLTRVVEEGTPLLQYCDPLVDRPHCASGRELALNEPVCEVQKLKGSGLPAVNATGLSRQRTHRLVEEGYPLQTNLSFSLERAELSGHPCSFLVLLEFGPFPFAPNSYVEHTHVTARSGLNPKGLGIKSA
ncbi:hypothetical protein BD414DRAFT_580835 [Trametes punicea]|nr:hypothetical protein BD414DRAFT_580835 [Trametes punicea]